ncbi:MAG: riboflavin synthase [Gemmatimonadota bacterium]|nr:MAG: riboflavin synthase [Gemmatimonadota bacterium]
MFTGIVTAMGSVARVQREGERCALTIEAPYPDLAVGESVSINGACMTIVETGEGWFTIEAVVTTRGRTRFGEIRVGERVNLERAMAAGDRFGGHWVQGHVDGVAEVRGVRTEADAVLIDIAVPPDVAEISVPYGSITVDGVSMTVNAVPHPGVVQLSVIPFTRDHTTLGLLEPGDRVHVEADIIGKYVKQVLDTRGVTGGGNG